jgi:pyruvate dehydrogenase E1 component alpha subunit
MPEKVIEKFSVKYLQILNEKGKFDEKLKPKLTTTDLKKMYELMLLTRTLDDKMLNLQRQGRIGTFAQVKGQEATNVGSAYALQKKDWMFPAFREQGAYLTHGLPMENILLYYGGDERGSIIPMDVNMFNFVVPVGTQTLHAVGHAIASKIKKEKIVTLVYFGDGATSEGDVNEAMNFAGAFDAPIVFICQNNHYAISLHVSKQTKASTLAQRAIGFGFNGVQVDGNDIFAVYKATDEAIKKARSGKGPTLIECVTYRMANHTTADDSNKYRSEKEVKEWEKKDPIERLKKYMIKKGYWNEKADKELHLKVAEDVTAAVEKFEKVPAPKVDDIFSYMYEKMPWNLEEQLKELKNGES